MLATPAVQIPGLLSLKDRLLIQCGPEDTGSVLPLVRAGSGVVLTGSRGLSAARAARTVWRGPVLVDRARYAGKGRSVAGSPLSCDWIASQEQASVTAPLTDSGYIADGDTAGLLSVLAGATAFGPHVVAVLPLHRRWLACDSAVLSAAINLHQQPVAIVVEHRGDPFGSPAVIKGLVALLAACSSPVMLLRSDVSALGALAQGALAGTFGIRSSLRHLYEQSKSGGRPTGAAAALWDPGLYMVGVDRLARARARTPADPAWVCRCATCRGRTLDWLTLSATDQDIVAHNVEVLLDRRDHLAAAPPGLRPAVWRAACKSAEFEFSAASATTVGWTVPPSVTGWKSA